MSSPNRKTKKGISRRDFLKGIGGGAVGTAITTGLLRPASGLPARQEAPLPLLGKKTINFELNGKQVSVEVEPRETLLQLLREKLRLTGTKRLCDHGSCGGCTVLVNNQAVYSCLYPAFKVDGKSVLTVEGLAQGDKLHPVQQAFIDHDAYQCGFCTPGFIMATLALLRQKASPSLEEVKVGLNGNLCRCGNQVKILAAVKALASQKGGVL
jgi:xanthine dehydrogenase YagT iron-sulfur-binding subunit